MRIERLLCRKSGPARREHTHLCPWCLELVEVAWLSPSPAVDAEPPRSPFLCRHCIGVRGERVRTLAVRAVGVAGWSAFEQAASDLGLTSLTGRWGALAFNPRPSQTFLPSGLSAGEREQSRVVLLALGTMAPVPEQGKSRHPLNALASLWIDERTEPLEVARDLDHLLRISKGLGLGGTVLLQRIPVQTSAQNLPPVIAGRVARYFGPVSFGSAFPGR